MGYLVLMRAPIIAVVVGLCSAANAAPAPDGRVVGKVTVTDTDGKVATPDVIVYVVGYAEDGTKGTTAQVAQKDRKFVPELVAVTAGESVSFPNGDSFLHNVFSQSPARKFDLGSFKKGESKDKAFPELGVVDVYCNIHPEMAATILVLPNKRHVSVARDGTFTIEGVRPGTWTVFAYTRRATRPSSAKITVEASKDAKVELALVRGPEPEHLNKYGEKYHGAGATYH
jgi:plastocyanin